MTPLALEMLLWFCTRTAEAGPFPNLKTHEPQKEIRNWMLADGIIEPWDFFSREPIYRATDKGRAWLDMILATPMPEQKWVDPRTEVSNKSPLDIQAELMEQIPWVSGQTPRRPDRAEDFAMWWTTRTGEAAGWTPMRALEEWRKEKGFAV